MTGEEQVRGEEDRRVEYVPNLKGQKITVRLLNGQPITGVLVGSSKFEIMMEVGTKRILVFKHAISTIEFP